MESATFDSPDNLFEHFKVHGTFVGPRNGPNRRTHDQKELFNLRQYLTTLAANGLLRFPLTVEKGERPDFMLTDGGAVTWGLEVTEATTRVFQRELTESEGEETEDFELYSDEGWAGDSPEREACVAILRAMQRKARKIRESGYRQLPRQDILVYVSMRAFFYDVHKAISMLVRRTSRFPDQWTGLGHVSVITSLRLHHDVTGKLIHLPLFDPDR